jgi:hypothetical protein
MMLGWIACIVLGVCFVIYCAASKFRIEGLEDEVSRLTFENAKLKKRPKAPEELFFGEYSK